MLLPVHTVTRVSDIPKQEISNPTLRSLAICFQENLKQNYSLVKITSPGSLCKEILYELMSRRELTGIEVGSTGIRIVQIDDSVVISCDGESPDVTLANTSLSEVQNNLVNNMIITDRRGFFCPETVNIVLNHIVTDLEKHPEKFSKDVQFYRGVALYILDNHREIIIAELMFAAVRHCVAQSESYSDKILVQATKIAIRLSTNCLNYTNSAQRIIESQSEYSSEVIISAALYIVLNDYSYGQKIILAAIKCIFKNAENCSWKIILKATEVAIRYSTRCKTQDVPSTAQRLIESPGSADSIESIISAALYIFLNDHSYGLKIKLAAIKCIFLYAENCSWKLILKATEVAIRHSEHYKGEDIAGTAQRIIESPDTEYQPELLMSAAIYLVLYDEKYTATNLNVLAKQIIEKIKVHGYSSKLAEQAALEFINQNIRFFTEPVKNQREFVEFFRRNDKMDILSEYSNNLMNALTVDDSNADEVNLFEVQDNDSKKYLLSITGLWNSGLFNYAVQLNKKVPIFILSNMEHEAIRHWNSRPFPPSQPDPTDRRYKRSIKID